MTETPVYTVIKQQGGLELRQYAHMILAEVEVEAGSYKAAAERGFSMLAGYIFGNNISRQKLAMTTPVQTERSEKIAMTAPVTVSGAGSYKVAFIMPSAYSLQNLPQPADSRVSLREVPARQVAAARFAGYFQPERIRQAKERVNAWLEEQGLQKEGDFVVAAYNPPWVPGFLGRNEVLVNVKDGASTQVNRA